LGDVGERHRSTLGVDALHEVVSGVADARHDDRDEAEEVEPLVYASGTGLDYPKVRPIEMHGALGGLQFANATNAANREENG
jgi:hypothetical protein